MGPVLGNHTGETKGLPLQCSDGCWLAAYTLPRHEKVVQEQLSLRGVESFLPLYGKISQWKDRVVQLHLPLFPCYIFVHIPLARRVRVLESPGVIRLVGFSGHPAILPDEDIEALQRSLETRNAEPCPYLSAGKRVRVASGPLQGLEGVVMRRKKDLRIVVSVDCILRSVSLEVQASELCEAA
jgi:transcription antitermination factor NusG